jgi:hypothetical protein
MLNPEGGPGFGIALPGSSDPKAIDAFLQGNRSYDAELVWSAYSPDAQERLRARGAGLEDLKRQLAAAKERGTRIDEASYVGAHPLPDGSTMHFYLLRVSNQVLQAQSQTQSQGLTATQTLREYVPYAFTVDASGKISRVQ